MLFSETNIATLYSKLLILKNRGSLSKPSEIVRKVCLETERIFKSFPISLKCYKKDAKFIWNQTKLNLFKFGIQFDKNYCNENTSILNTHKDQLTNVIIYKYLDIIMHHEIRKKNDELTSRAKYTKLILFQNQ